MSEKIPFWKRKKLSEMTEEEWESLCDCCGKCCLEKIAFEDDTFAFTNIACKLLDIKTCRCRHYMNRKNFIPECIRIQLKDLEEYYWLPKTCAYRLLYEGKDLPAWHPLNTRSEDSVHQAKMSVRGRCVTAKPEEVFQDYIVEWEDL